MYRCGLELSLQLLENQALCQGLRNKRVRKGTENESNLAAVKENVGAISGYVFSMLAIRR